MRLLSLLEERKSGAIWYVLFRQSPNAPETRRLRIDKNVDRFDERAGDTIPQIAVDQARSGVWMPPSRQPDELLFNAVKVVLPSTIHAAATTHCHGKDALKALLEITDTAPYPWVAKGGRLILSRALKTGEQNLAIATCWPSFFVQAAAEHQVPFLISALRVVTFLETWLLQRIYGRYLLAPSPSGRGPG